MRIHAPALGIPGAQCVVWDEGHSENREPSRKDLQTAFRNFDRLAAAYTRTFHGRVLPPARALFPRGSRAVRLFWRLDAAEPQALLFTTLRDCANWNCWLVGRWTPSDVRELGGRWTSRPWRPIQPWLEGAQLRTPDQTIWELLQLAALSR